MLHRIQQAGAQRSLNSFRHENGTFLLQSTPWGSDLGLDWVLLASMDSTRH